MQKRSITAIPIEASEVVIDGRLDEDIWRRAPVASRFSQTSPKAGALATLNTEVRVLYDGKSLYVGMRMFDPTPDAIVAPYVRRDDETNCDWAFVEIDSRHDSRSGFSFGLNPRGVQADGAWLDDNVYDPSWDGVWEGASSIDSQGWTAEFKIPFSQLALRNQTGDVIWGINFYRSSPRHGETSVWAPRVPWFAGIVSKFNDLHLRLLERSKRFEFAPFAVPQFETQSRDRSHVANDRSSVRGGADFRIGLGPSFTLAGAVYPDFGQVEADPEQLNLTSFELFQAERRPFFVQGMDAFRFDDSLNFVTRANSFREESAFYSRRIGRAPRGTVSPGTFVVAEPSASVIVSALKLSGQTESGWNIGALSATTKSAHADVRDAQGPLSQVIVEPMAQIGLLRVNKLFSENKTSLGIFLSSTIHPALPADLAETFIRQSWLAGFDGRHRFRHQQYEVAGWFLGSRLSGSSEAIRNTTRQPHHYFQRPDASYLGDLGTGKTLSGFSSQARISKVGGNLHWDLIGEAISPGFDMNELGFQRNSDWAMLVATWQYQRYTPGHFVRHWTVGSDRLGLGWNWATESRARTVNGFALVDFSNYWNVSTSWVHDFPTLSTEWLRGGPSLRLPSRDSIHTIITSDQRRPSYAQLDAIYTLEPSTQSATWMLNPQMNLRNSNHFRFSLGLLVQRDVVGRQYAAAGSSDGSTEYLVARLEQATISPTVRADYAFSRQFVVQSYFQPFVSRGQYDHYQRLVDPRATHIQRQFSALTASQILQNTIGGNTSVDLNGDGVRDFSFPTPDNLQRTLNASIVLRWEYRPGSFFTAVWNRQSAQIDPLPRGSLVKGLGGLWRDPSTNIFLIKVSYYLSRK